MLFYAQLQQMSGKWNDKWENNGKKMDERYVDKWWKNGQFQGPTQSTLVVHVDPTIN